MAGHHALTLSPFVFARKSKISPPTPRNLPTIQNELLKEHVSGQTELDIFRQLQKTGANTPK